MSVTQPAEISGSGRARRIVLSSSFSRPRPLGRILAKCIYHTLAIIDHLPAVSLTYPFRRYVYLSAVAVSLQCNCQLLRRPGTGLRHSLVFSFA